MNKILLSFLGLFFLLCSCSKQKEEPLPYLVQYKAQVTTPEAFLKKLIIQSYIKYKEQRAEKLEEERNLESLKKDTLALIIQDIFVNDLANKNSIVILDKELKEWIKKRSDGTRSENLNLFLNTNGLKKSDWIRMFKNQLLMHKVKGFLSEKEDSKSQKNKQKKPSSKNLETYVEIGVISYDDKHEAETAYTRIRRGATNIKNLMKAKTGSSKYQWLPISALPFKEKAKTIRIKRISKVFQSDWGYSLIFVNKREKKSSSKPDNAPSQQDAKWVSALKDFKSSKDLKINYDLFYGLKLKK